MNGINISQARAYELSEHFEVYLSPTTGFWICTDGIDQDTYTYSIYKTGDKIEEIPNDAFRFTFEITLSEASQKYNIPYPTLAEWARTNKLDSRKSGGTWLTTPQAIERLLKKGGDSNG